MSAVGDHYETRCLDCVANDQIKAAPGVFVNFFLQNEPEALPDLSPFNVGQPAKFEHVED